jgi:3-oxoacyl-[acyl-carrier protein] reductase
MTFKGKTVLVTGANNPLGIGAATARAFASRGAKVALTYLQIPPSSTLPESGAGLALYEKQRAKSADEVVVSIAREGGIAAALQYDLDMSDAAPKLFDWAESTFGPVDILINNAAHYEAEGDDIFSITAAGIDRTLRINFRAAILLIQEFAVRCRRRVAISGRVINVSTDAAQSFAGQITYGASKAGVEALTRSIAKELGPYGITVNAIAPGPVQTGYISPQAEAALTQTIPLRRIGTSQDIANAVLFLASEAANWITGQVIRVSGGHEL